MFPGRKPRRYGISHIHLRAAGISQRRRRTGAVARFRTPLAASGGADSPQAEPAGAGVLRKGRPGAGDLPAGVSRYRELHASIARQLPALAFGHRRPRHHRPRAVPGPGAAGGARKCPSGRPAMERKLAHLVILQTWPTVSRQGSSSTTVPSSICALGSRRAVPWTVSLIT